MTSRFFLRVISRFPEASAAGFLGPLRVLVQERELLYLLLRREIVARTSGTLLGGVWLLLQPGLQILAFWFLLDFVLRIKVPGKVAFVDYFLTGMLPWLFVSEVLLRNLSVMNEFNMLYKKTVFPLKALPLLPALVAGIVYLPVFIVVAGFLIGPEGAIKAVVVLIALWVWLIPFGYLLAVLGCFLKDLRQVFPFVLTMIFYLTPILYPPEMLPSDFRSALSLNPVADVMALIHGLLQDMPITTGNFLRPGLYWVLLLAPAWVLYHRAEPYMREVL
ncbi:ABC transporter permease [Methylococcus geothermalis]|uniref:ABC transporter permease n=1 Tax=Methylococcus geothermalis TaxID=2681310 RepID=A0A858QBX7_9GAMM|nr:ABC transporter permease [Methylococcus geothermalis]QJD31196.1 ABC transporter permease [Methylococcus geothermalis]